MTTWSKLFLWVLHSCLLVHLCRGLEEKSEGRETIECVCSTQECRREQKATCRATNFCYIQHLRSDVVKGCIDESTPLLCENRRPTTYTGSWPVLLCCKEDFCNKDAVPTLPTWLTDIEREPKPKPIVPEEEEKQDNIPYDDYESSDPKFYTSPPRRPKTVNPLYVAVPAAGACVLIAIIIFAIYVLTRQNHYIEEYPYHSNLRHQQHQQNIVKDPQNAKKSLYQDCERSSSGSETKLLMKV